LVSGIFPPDIGGPANYLPKLAERLDYFKNEVETISLSANFTESSKGYPFKLTLISRNHSKLARVLKTVLTVRARLKESEMIFINGLYVECAIALFGMKNFSVAKIVGDPVWERYRNKNNRNVPIEVFNDQFRGFSYWVERRVFTWALNRFDVISCPSRDLARMISSWKVKGEVMVIENGTLCRTAGSNHNDHRYDVVTLSRLVKWKNIDKLIEACAMSGHTLAVGGVGPEEESLKQLAKTLKAKVDFVGKVLPQNTQEFLGKAPIFALLSSYEGMSFSLIQAMMNGSRILVSNANGNSDVIQNGFSGIVLESSQKALVASKLTDLREDSILNLQLGENARETALRFYCLESQLDKMILLLGRGCQNWN
jgi:glycosyltransferase involved in cell wall biosynthesis